MGLSSNGGPFAAAAYGQGAAGPGQQLNAQQQQQLQNKATLANSLPPFPNELKGANVTSVPSMVSSELGLKTLAAHVEAKTPRLKEPHWIPFLTLFFIELLSWVLNQFQRTKK